MARLPLVTKQMWDALTTALGQWQAGQRAAIDAALTDTQAATAAANTAAQNAGQSIAYTDAQIQQLSTLEMVQPAGLAGLSPYPVLEILSPAEVPNFLPVAVTRKLRSDMQWLPNTPAVELSIGAAGNVDARWYWDAAPKTVPAGTAAQAICAAIWVDNPADFSSVTLSLTTISGSTVQQWSRPAGALKKGWNLVRIAATSGVVVDASGNPQWNSFYRLRVLGVATKAARLVIGSIWAECPQKARIVIVADGSYEGWYRNLYPTQIKDASGNALPSMYEALKARNCPTTWAWNPYRTLNNETGVVSAADAQVLRFDGLSGHTFHSWSSAKGPPYLPTKDMSYEQLYADSLNSVSWLTGTMGQDPRYIVRGAVHQNEAPNWLAMQGLLAGSATWHSGASLTIFPWTDPWDIPRLGMHGRDEAWFRPYFNQLKATKGVAVFYTHKLVPTGSSPTAQVDIEQDEWEGFLRVLDEGLAGGWLEVVTFARLYHSLRPNPAQQQVESGALAALRRSVY